MKLHVSIDLTAEERRAVEWLRGGSSLLSGEEARAWATAAVVDALDAVVMDWKKHGRREAEK